MRTLYSWSVIHLNSGDALHRWTGYWRHGAAPQSCFMLGIDPNMEAIVQLQHLSEPETLSWGFVQQITCFFDAVWIQKCLTKLRWTRRYTCFSTRQLIKCVNNEVLIIRMAEGSLYLKCLDVRFNWKCQVCSATGGANIIQLRPVMLSWPWPALDQRWLPKSFCTEQLKPVIHVRLKRCLYPFKHNWQQRYLAIKAN